MFIGEYYFKLKFNAYTFYGIKLFNKLTNPPKSLLSKKEIKELEMKSKLEFKKYKKEQRLLSKIKETIPNE